VRQIGHHIDRPPSVTNHQDPTVAQLCNQLERVQKETDEVSKELGRLKLLSEQAKPATPIIDRASTTIVHTDVDRTVGDRRLPQSKFFHEDDRICHFCEVKGHIARNCPRRTKVSFDHNKSRKDQTSEDKTDKNINDGTNKKSFGISNSGPSKVTYLRMSISGVEVFGLLDSGSDVTLLPTAIVKGVQLKPVKQALYAANGTKVPVLGEAEVVAYVGKVPIVIVGLVSNHVADLILGVNFLSEHGVVWNFRNGVARVDGVEHSLHVRGHHNWCRRFVLCENTVLPPHSESILATNVSGRLEGYSWAIATSQSLPGVSVAHTL